MASPERAPRTDRPTLEARLSSLEETATRLRQELERLQDEVARMQDDEIEWGEPPPALHARGWIRATLFLAVVGLVALVSVPYLSHLLDAAGPSADPVPLEIGRRAPSAAPAAPPASATAVPAAARRPPVPAPARAPAEPEEFREPARGSAPVPRAAIPSPRVVPGDARLAPEPEPDDPKGPQPAQSP